jgi:hypothetical protein
MNSEERNVWVALVSSLAVNTWFAFAIWGMFHDGTAAAPDGLQTWARTILWVVPAAIVANIALTVLAAILQSILTGEPRIIFLKDERDRQFELWGLGATMLFMVLGFFGSMIGLAFGISAFVAFNLVYLTFFLGDLAGNLVKLGCYRALT